MDRTIGIGLFNKSGAFAFSFVRIPNTSRNSLSIIGFSIISSKSLRIAKASNNLSHSLQQLNYLLLI